jgi:hypothetical protein
MKVYRLVNDVNHYQYFLPEQEADGPKLWTKCEPMIDTWQPPPVYIYRPKYKPGDLYNFVSGSPIFSPRATELLRTHLEMAGELLELPYMGQSYCLLNVLECINCLDEVRTTWGQYKNGVRKPLPEKYVFHRNRFSESCLFKIPETHLVDVLVVDREDGEGFIDALLEHRISGYELELLWSD